jgi:hypothetical protein
MLEVLVGGRIQSSSSGIKAEGKGSKERICTERAEGCRTEDETEQATHNCHFVPAISVLK